MNILFYSISPEVMKNEPSQGKGAQRYVTFVVFFILTVIFYVNIKSGNNFIRVESPSPFRTQTFNITIISKGMVINPQKVVHSICPTFSGRIGNKLFIYASSYGIARSKGMEVVINTNCELLKYFTLYADVRKDTSICDSQNIKTLKEEHSAVYDKRILDFNNTQNVRLLQYLQSYLYFDQYKEELRDQFTFSDKMIKKATLILDNKLKGYNIYRNSTYHKNHKYKYMKVYNETSHKKITLIGVHIRRGDWTKYPDAGYNVPTKEYLRKAVEWYQSRMENLVFVVASNGMKWAKDNMPKNITTVFLEGNSAWLDLATVTLCEHFISSSGTFSWWAAWLTGGNVTFFKWPAKEGTRFRTAYSKDYKDYYYSHWIGL
ncbi:galactoside alpha-(1,2)-fucosyltransferase 2-like isoform X2 [Mytilus galloprovincialis]|uniref:galactoside alpha-(1,2)-fucosyltransferase 2-like isoform X2 n=1 Tax=Mytilus galloprovincialis TaxID=29158 RepID=UPI003F7C2D8F